MSFWNELKQRRLFPIAATYLAVGWVAVEALDFLSQKGVVPDLLPGLAMVWYLVGIPLVFIIGWYHGERGPQRVTRVEAILVLVLASAGLGATWLTVSGERSRRLQEAAAMDGLSLNRVAVLYFQDLTPGGDLRHIADGFTEGLIDELAGVRELRVVSRNGVEPYRGAGVPADSIGRALGVGTIVDGTVEQAGDDLRISLRLLDGEGGHVFERTRFTVPAADPGRAQQEIVEQAAALLRSWVGREFRLQQTRRGTGSAVAWALYHRGEQARKEAEAAARHGDSHAMAGAFTRADSLLARAETLDPRWVEPPVLRAHVAFRRARIDGGAGRMHDAAHWIEAGLPHAERAVALEPNNARALEARGSLRYLYRLLEVDHDRERLARVLAGAQQDLERAVQLNPSLASAHATLGHLHLRRDVAAAMISSRRAYEEDAYLENADVVVDRIFYAAYNLENFPEARRWCEVGQARFPTDYRFAKCELRLLAAPAVQPDVARAWAVLERIERLAPEFQAEVEAIEGMLMVGGVLARAELPDSARSVWRRARARATPHVDPHRDMYRVEAYMRTLAGDVDEAIDLLKLYAAVNQGASFDDDWWFRDLRRQPRWSELAATTYH